MAGELLVESDAGVVRLTLNRPERRNALSHALLSELERALEPIAADQTARVVVLGARGSAFCSGHDLAEMVGRTEGEYRDLFELCSRVMLGLRRLPQPVIARVHGVATAAGCQLVAACDLAVASTEARFATSGINYGLFCATPGVPVSRNVSRKRAFEMLFTGEFVDAETARDWGLVNRVVVPSELDAEVQRLAAAIIEKPAAVCAAGKALFYEQIEARLAQAYAAASNSITRNMLGDDAAEGVGAFIEKRKPRWDR